MTIDGIETMTIKDTIVAFLDTFVPISRDTPELYSTHININVEEQYAKVYEAELHKAIWRVGPNKAPGIDGITAKSSGKHGRR